jgi:hypothetical protein
MRQGFWISAIVAALVMSACVTSDKAWHANKRIVVLMVNTESVEQAVVRIQSIEGAPATGLFGDTAPVAELTFAQDANAGWCRLVSTYQEGQASQPNRQRSDRLTREYLKGARSPQSRSPYTLSLYPVSKGENFWLFQKPPLVAGYSFAPSLMLDNDISGELVLIEVVSRGSIPISPDFSKGATLELDPPSPGPAIVVPPSPVVIVGPAKLEMSGDKGVTLRWL